jgi:DNA-binding response OmpR family regulator
MNGKILIISNNPVIQRNLKKILELEGYSCSVFSPHESEIFLDSFFIHPVPEMGEDTAFISNQYDLGILDTNRPGRFSKKYLAWVKEKCPDLPIIALIDEGNKTWPVSESSSLIELAKPFKSRQILELIRYILPAADNPVMADGRQAG